MVLALLNQEIAQLYRHSLCESEKFLDSLHVHENVNSTRNPHANTHVKG